MTKPAPIIARLALAAVEGPYDPQNEREALCFVFSQYVGQEMLRLSKEAEAQRGMTAQQVADEARQVLVSQAAREGRIISEADLRNSGNGKFELAGDEKAIVAQILADFSVTAVNLWADPRGLDNETITPLLEKVPFLDTLRGHLSPDRFQVVKVRAVGELLIAANLMRATARKLAPPGTHLQVGFIPARPA